jgi:hypothetical protein
MTAERVFISYRRADTSHFVGRLQEVISERYGRDSVFMDVESIRPGQDYVVAIDSAVSRSRVLLVVIGSSWLSADSQGLRRIDNPQDRLRLEVEAGLRHTTHVIPVLVDSASMPKTRDLPESLVPLSRHHAIRISHDSFRGDTAHLFEILDQYLRETSPSPARWVSVGLLVAFVLGLVAYRSAGAEAVAASRDPRGNWAQDDLRATLLWLLPVLPAVLAAILVAARKAPGAALGCLIGSILWVVTSLVFVSWRAEGVTTGAHLVALVVLVLAVGALLVAEPRLRSPVRQNRGGPASAAALLLAASIALRVGAPAVAHAVSGDTSAFDWGHEVAQPTFWLSVLIPVVICLPAVLARLDDEQAQALRTAAILQILYPLFFRSVTIADANDPALAATDAAVFLAGCVCMLLSVRAGQSGVAGRSSGAA